MGLSPSTFRNISSLLSLRLTRGLFPSEREIDIATGIMDRNRHSPAPFGCQLLGASSRRSAESQRAQVYRKVGNSEPHLVQRNILT